MRSKNTLIIFIGLIVIVSSIVYALTSSVANVSTKFEEDTRAYGIDVSHWQGTVNWNEVYSQGYRFAFVKATEGTSYVDSEFTTNMENGHEAGLYMGAYHFAEPNTPVVSDAQSEADHFVNVISPYLRAGYLVPVLDLESNSNDLTWAQLTDWANAFCSRVYNETGLRPIIYVNSYWASNLGSELTQWDLWIAQYTYDPSEQPSTGVWSTWSFWQYSDKGNVTGVSGDVDLDVFNGNLQTLIDTYVIKSRNVIEPLYDHLAAYGYVYRWWNGQNGHYRAYGNASAESANFVSQALIAGGLSLWMGYDGNGDGLSESNGTLPLCSYLHRNLVLYENVSYSYVTRDNFSVPEDLEVGDVIIFGNESGEHWEYAGLVVYRNGNDVGIATHYPNAWNESLSNYFPSKYDRINYYHIFPGSKHIIQPFKVTATALNVREGPGTGYQIIGTIQNGEVYVAYNYHTDKNGNRWWEFFYDDRVAWCASWYTENVSNAVFQVNVSTYLNVRTGPGIGYKNIGAVYHGMLFARIGQQYNETEGRTWYSFWWSSRSSWVASEYTINVPEFSPWIIISFIALMIALIKRRVARFL